jgi:cold shock CspA family protein
MLALRRSLIAAVRQAPVMNMAVRGLASHPDALKGTCKWFDSKKGFGFITPDAGGQDVFAHQTTIHADGFRSLGEGEAVEYLVKTDAQGRTQAENVTGPDGAFVVGSPPPRRDDYYDEY